MADLNENEREKELREWGIQDAESQTEAIQHMPMSASGRFEFITKNSKRKVIPSTCSLQEHAISSQVMHLVSCPNTPSVLLENVTYVSACNDFRRLLCLIDTYPEPGKSDLATLIFPVFVYFYLLLLQSGPSGYFDAQSFFKKNKEVFAGHESYVEVLETLCSFRDWMDVKDHYYFKNFLECKYTVTISEEALLDLKSFVQSETKKGDRALLYVLHLHIHFQDNDEAEYIENACKEIYTVKTDSATNDDASQDDAETDDTINDDEILDDFTIDDTIVDDTIVDDTIQDVTKDDTQSDSDEKDDDQKDDDQKEDSEIDDARKEDVSSDPMMDDTLSQVINERCMENLYLAADKLSSSSSSSENSDSDDEISKSSDSELEVLLKELSVNHPLISTVVSTCTEANIICLDINEDDTEIAYAFGKNYICTAPLGTNVKNIAYREDSDEGTPEQQQFEEEIIDISSSIPSLPMTEVSTPPLQKNWVELFKTPTSVKKLESSECPIITNDMKSDEEEQYESSESPSGVRGLKKFEAPMDVYIVKYLPGKPGVLLAASDTIVRLLNTQSSSFETKYIGNSSIFDVDVNSTAQCFATANSRGSAYLYCFTVNVPIQTFVGHLSAVTAVKFHPNGLYLATGSEDASVRLYDIDSGLCVRKLFDYNSCIMTLAFSHDGKLLSCGDSFGAVSVWDIKDGRGIAPRVSFSNVIEIMAKITCLCFDSESSLIMACNYKGECKLWDARNPENILPLNFKNTPLKISHKHGRWNIAFHENS